jgi:hypothetical protein
MTSRGWFLPVVPSLLQHPVLVHGRYDFTFGPCTSKKARYLDGEMLSLYW